MDTSRPKHQYYLFVGTKETIIKATVRFILLASPLLLKGDQRGIIFALSVDLGKALKKYLKLDFIHSNIKDKKIRSGMLKKWQDGDSGSWIISITSLIQGVDYHDVQIVLFVGTPFRLIDFVQGAGQAGRTGKPSKLWYSPTGNSGSPL